MSVAVAPTDTLTALLEEGRRQLDVCNACRYCEGYCAVFPALERRAIFSDGDVWYLANLCHDCRACYQACPYTPPHEFAVDLPTVLSEVRAQSYRRMAWPARLAVAFERPFLTQFTAMIAALALVLVVVAALGSFEHTTGDGAFYRVIPAFTMEVLFLALSALVIGALAGSFVRFWRETSGGSPSIGALLRALGDVLTLRFMGGGGGGCYYPEPEIPARSRRVMHLLMLHGLLLTFAATVAAAIEHRILGILPPYPILSAPVLLGTIGGIGVVVGGTGLAVLKASATGVWAIGDARLDFAFLLTLEVTAVTGLLLLCLRASEAMPWLLIIHLAAVVALYLVVPFSKFVHASHRFAALLRDADERVNGLR
jgi:citrate/tricarballylate utilization protein